MRSPCNVSRVSWRHIHWVVFLMACHYQNCCFIASGYHWHKHGTMSWLYFCNFVLWRVKTLVEGIDNITNCFVWLEPMTSLQTLDLTMSVGTYYQIGGKEINWCCPWMQWFRADDGGLDANHKYITRTSVSSTLGEFQEEMGLDTVQYKSSKVGHLNLWRQW